jgi:hypothetical protein
MEDSKARIGQFFFFVGTILLVVFFSVDPAGNPQVNLCLSGATLLLFGIFLIWRGWRRPPPAERFRLMKRIQNRPPKEKGKKNKE